jgi:hypothetical protein
VNDPFHTLQCGIDRARAPHVALLELNAQRSTPSGLETVDVDAQRVEDTHTVAAIQKAAHHMLSNKAGAAGHEYPQGVPQAVGGSKKFNF